MDRTENYDLKSGAVCNDTQLCPQQPLWTVSKNYCFTHYSVLLEKIQLSTRHQRSRVNNRRHLLRNHTERVCQWMGHCILHVMLGKNKNVGSYKEHWLDKPTSQDLKYFWEEVTFLLSCVWVKDLRISVTHWLSSRWEGSPRICHLSKLKTIKDHAASMSYVSFGYQTEVIKALDQSICTSLTETSILWRRSNPTRMSRVFNRTKKD